MSGYGVEGANEPSVAWSCRATSPVEAGECLASFEAFAHRADLPDAVRKDLAVILDELVTNAARHALAQTKPAGAPGAGDAGDAEWDEAAAIEMELVRAGESWELRLIDRGPEFDPAAAPPAGAAVAANDVLPLAQRVPGGVGLELVRQLADGVTYERRDGVNCLGVRVGVRGRTGSGR